MNKIETVNNDIWLLLDSRNTGGIESHILQLAEGLNNYGVNTTVVFFTDYGEHPLRNSLQKLGIKSIDLDGRLSTLVKVARKNRPSIIHTHGYKAGIFGRLAARICAIPAVSTYHAGEISSGKLALYDWLDRKTARLASRVFAVSPQIAERLSVKTKVVDNFVSTSGLNITAGKQIAFVGRLSVEKGADYFLDLAGRFPDCQFHIYGDGPQSEALEELAKSNTCFHGQQDDMASTWERIELLIMPSRHEGLPMAALEAMARGIPVLASDVGALDQLIDSDSNGWLVKPGSIDELENRVHQWLGMSGQKKYRFKTAARKKIQKRFSADIAIPDLVLSYRELAL
jgi:glycosyltransferase involved in cell wall biosynthesis